jgi:hypothetical protein
MMLVDAMRRLIKGLFRRRGEFQTTRDILALLIAPAELRYQ